MLKTIRNLYLRVSKFVFDSSSPHGSKRSLHWAKLEKEFVLANPICVACGSVEKLQVHHVTPFHLHPELELEPTNLISLCMSKGNECHFMIGHAQSWKAYNPNVRVDAATTLSDVTKRIEIIESAKKNRLLH